ncbi:hemolysin family protein [Paenibacillus radicis (ex Xue et al. 2023)]|uniref:Hemolysin family protein n=1 Tax=Paenibacillus radicis (ex Xue et al. 2023) TaxID=2972489 RepID=A0ABT1Y8X0_9BACL|nr:hemolysin family protein [Paenibacillus radicis (ex Xue et al. 2023)]MCR8629644.1 hemolysin family protein [Paenibacillus radicis (ex Xue et al. 2023)]
MGLNLFLVAVLILLSAFFVATEFAIIRLRSSRVDQLVLEGRKNAVAVQKVISNLDGYLSACQLGITITALGLGWLGEPTVEKILHPLFQSLNLSEELNGIVSFIIAFVFITYIHVVLGELAPKSLAIQKAEQISLLTATPIIWFSKIMYPFIWALNGSANQLIKLFGLKPATEHEEAHSEQEIQIIVSESYQSGKINKTEYGYVNKIFAFDDMLAREIMVPRTDMICLFSDRSLEENLKIIRREQYTRFPIAQESKDNIVGIINTKHFFLNYDNNPEQFDFKSLVQPVLTVPEYIPVNTLLKRMQKERVHIAILVDEYGGTSGLITMEDILEEIVGEIRDEFDADEVKEIEKIDDNKYIFDGKVLLNEVNDLLGTNLINEDVDTIGGWLYTQAPDLEAGKAWNYDDVSFVILKKDSHRIRKIEIQKLSPASSVETP